MDEDKKSYWMQIPDEAVEARTDEFPPGLVEQAMASGGLSRREFFKVMGYGLLSMPIVSCSRMPFVKAVGFLDKEESVIPGVAKWYATTCAACPAHCSIVAKTREGRPIKLEGNALAPVGKGGLCGLGQASLLPIYDSFRYADPLENDVGTTWAQLDEKVIQALSSVKDKKIVVLSKRLSSPSSVAAIAEFKKKYPATEHVVYEAYSESAFYESQRMTHGFAGTLRYDLGDVDYVLGVNADFLGTWQNPVEMTKQFSARRNPLSAKGMIKHAQIESYLSLTGSNADLRVGMKPSQQEGALYYLLNALLMKSGRSGISLAAAPAQKGKLDKIAESLWSHKGRSLVLCGTNHLPSQVAVNLVNQLLGAYGRSIHLEKNKYVALESDARFESFVEQLKSDSIGAVVVWDANPVYDYPASDFATAFKRVPTRISMNSYPDETSVLCSLVAASSQPLESWNDYAPSAGVIQVGQPTVTPILRTRSAQESLLRWAGIDVPYYEYIRNYWKTEFFTKQGTHLFFEKFWNQSVHDGFFKVGKVEESFENAPGAQALAIVAKAAASIAPVQDWELVLYESVALRDGAQANNAWLQELPDPITKLTWDNAVLVAPSDAKKLGLKDGDNLELKVGAVAAVLPVIVQPGQPAGVAAVSVGYGRSVSGKVGKGVGVNAYAFGSVKAGTRVYATDKVAVKKVAGTVKLARTQIHSSMEGREIVKETVFGDFKKGHGDNHSSPHLVSLWQDHDYKGHAWGLSVDLSKCTGCSACVVGCHTENNVPVVGKEEVQNFRDMHWMRIDRYYSGEADDPSTVHQPMLCHHCENAPCESVCPVLATVHSTEGLNQQVYNRCVGTRYCANNCPYKVRRFNWFDYDHGDELKKMVLNPDVVVRSRGVMEKCSLCVQRIEDGKRKAKLEGRPLGDGEIKTACQQSCPADAIVFGDLNDSKSVIRGLFEDKRKYALLEELNVKPRLTYLTKVRNRDAGDGT